MRFLVVLQIAIGISLFRMLTFRLAIYIFIINYIRSEDLYPGQAEACATSFTTTYPLFLARYYLDASTYGLAIGIDSFLPYL